MITKTYLEAMIDNIADSYSYGEICFFVFMLLISPLAIILNIITLPIQIIGGIVYLIKEWVQ